MKATRILALLLALVLTLGLCACGQSAQPTTDPAQSSGTETSSGTGTTDAAPTEETVTLSISICNFPIASAFGEAATYMIEKMEEYSGGTLTGQVYTDNSLGDSQSQVDALVDGTIDIVIVGDSYWTPYVPELQSVELPFLFSSVEEARAVLASEAGDNLRAMFDGTGLKILNFWEVGMRNFTNNGKPVTCIEDLQGVRMRCLPVDIQVYAWTLFGANCFAIDGSELYSSLQTGVVDAEENPLEGVWSNKIYEVQENVTLTNHVYTPAACGMSQKTWDKLSENQQQALLKAAAEAQQKCYELMDIRTGEALDNLRSCRTVIEDPDLSGFTALAPQVYDKFTETMPSAAPVLESLIAARDALR